jgi:hypothetical protein
MQDWILLVARFVLYNFDQSWHHLVYRLGLRRARRVFVLSPLFWIQSLDLFPKLFEHDFIIRWYWARLKLC